MTQGADVGLAIAFDVALFAIGYWLLIPGIRAWKAGDAETNEKVKTVIGAVIIAAAVVWVTIAALT